MEVINYLNLTNGLDFIKNVSDYKFVRIQSTLCEQHCWNQIVQDLDYNFLLDIASGNPVVVYDTSRKKDVSRALYQGLAFIEYVLRRRWLNDKPIANVRGHNVTEYFESQYKKLDKRTISKLDYIKKFLNAKNIVLTCVCDRSEHDGDYDYYRRLLKEAN